MGKLPSRKARIAAVAAGAALLAGVPGVAQARDQGGCTPGAPGIGDAYYPTYGNGGYDVRHYDLDVAYDPGTDVLTGDATVRATATQSLCSLNLDLVGLTVRGVEVDGRRASFTRSGQELVITPRRPLREGRRFEVEVRYDGVPVEFTLPGFDPPIRTGFMKTPEGVTVAGQPEVAAAWFPVNDHPLDKASYSFEVTVPDGYEVAANGFLRGRHRRHGQTTWNWEAREPMASYLATFNVADWDVTISRTDGGLPQYDAVDTNITGGLREQIDSSLARQGEIIDVLSEAFGPYPFSTVGAIVPNQEDLRFALENQTRPVYSKRFWRDPQGNPRNADWVVVHEIAHQWYGDDVALARWQDIWLNEGFATYAEWLWSEYEGEATTQERFDAVYALPADDAFWTVKIGDPGVDHLFDAPVYDRGAMTLQALRNEVGDDAFFAIAREWAATHSGGNVTTDQFIALAERISGQQLDDLFQTWLFTASKPVLAGAPSATALSGTSVERWQDATEQRLRIGRY